MSNSKNDVAWKGFFDKFNVVENVKVNGHVFLNSNDLKEFREARLMAKIDHKSQLPKPFSDHNLSILPVSRGSYIVANMDIFHSLDNEGDIEIKHIDFPTYLESLDYNNITSEAVAINCAFVTGILHDFTGEKELSPTVSGRMSSSNFDFFIDSGNKRINVCVDNSQLEIDAGFEGESSLNIIEAKTYLSDDFVIRQLYYPYRLWIGKVGKIVRTIFLTYTNGMFHLREYSFVSPNHYNSLELIRQSKYVIKEGGINLETIQKVLSQSKIVQEPQISFPQADSFDRVINLCELIKEKVNIEKDDITLNYDFDARQTNYYSDAARYLGLIDKKTENQKTVFFLTQKGNLVFKLPIADRQLEFARLILSHFVFKNVLEQYLTNGTVPSQEEVVEIMKNAGLYKVEANSTFRRRSSTIIAWVNWIIGLIEE